MEINQVIKDSDNENWFGCKKLMIFILHG